MAEKKVESKPFYQKHKRKLNQILKNYNREYEKLDFFDLYASAIFHTLETGITRYPLRNYQLEALFLLDKIFQLSKTSNGRSIENDAETIIQDLMEEIDTEAQFEAPFIGFEMATGSGKTMLMGACIYFLNKRYGIDNFLILTPASTDIYAKTIRNFSIGNYESVWADETPFTFNLITGENYTENLFYNENHDANIFIFNISKFGKNATNTEKTWESSIWRDENGNTISIRQFLRDKKLVIITDEAHHAQTPNANAIIKKFQPEALLEFTATAIEGKTSDKKKNQTIVYKYDIRRFLEDGHGKLVRAVALAESNGRKSRANEVSQAEKFKIILLFLIHLLKKEAVLQDLKSRELKPVAFIKVKNDTLYTQKIFDYITQEIHKDDDNLKIILAKLKAHDLEITKILVQFLQDKFNNDISKIQSAIRSSAIRSIFYHGRCDKETERKFLHIRRNEIEIVVYMQRLDEGIDLPNIYTMAVIQDTLTDLKTSVKQIVGRGVRLNKEKREFDNETDLLKAQSEKLHVICDRGKNFEEVILSIQKEFGLTDKYLSSESPGKNVWNRAKSELLEGKTVPNIKAELKAIPGMKLLDLISDVDTIAAEYIRHNCFKDQNGAEKYFLKFHPNSFIVEIDMLAEENKFHREIRNAGAHSAQLKIGERQLKAIYGIVHKQLFCLPDTKRIVRLFEAYIQKLNQTGLMYYRIDPVDEQLALNLFVNTFSFFYRNYVEGRYYTLHFNSMDSTEKWILKKQFKSEQIFIPTDQVENNQLKKIFDKEKFRELIKKQYHFHGYQNSIYDYVKFDSFTEKQLADYQESIINKNGNHQKPFWVRNQRNIFFEYGNRKYYPDFIMYYDGIIYVIEAKGEIYNDRRKRMLLAKLNEIPGYQGLLVFSKQVDEMGEDVWDFKRFMEFAKQVLAEVDSLQFKKEILDSIPEQEEEQLSLISE